MENAIEAAEKNVKDLQTALDDPTTGLDAAKSLELYRQLADAQQKLDNLFLRWQELEKR